MQVTINIPDELVAQAIADGSSPASYAENLLAARATVRTIQRPTKEQLNTALDALAQFSDRIPNLPDEAFTRASFYQDHD